MIHVILYSIQVELIGMIEWNDYIVIVFVGYILCLHVYFRSPTTERYCADRQKLVCAHE